MEGLQSPEARIAVLEDAIAEEIRLRKKLEESISMMLAREKTQLECENLMLRQHLERLTAAVDTTTTGSVKNLHQ